MDVLNKFCSSVSSTVSQLSAVLPGNPVTREYEATQHIASAGPGLVWKIYSGYKKSTRQEAAIFVFEKRQLERGGDRELLLESLRRGISQLTRLRHPQILVVHHQLEESRDCLAFATEPVFASLANILGSTENMPTLSSKHKLFDIEIKYGLLQVGEGLAFLHKDAKMLHQNLCPESIVINQQGAWKIFGFDFCVHNTSVETTPAWSCLDYRKSGPPMACPDLDYLAPECGLMERLTPASDVYSLGALVYTLYNQGEPLFANSRDWHLYSRNMAELKKLPASRLQCVAPGLRDLVCLMLNATPELRPDEHDFIKADFFEDVCVKALNYLDSLFQWDNRQKSQFYKGLPQITENLPHRVCLYRVIPCLVKEFVNPVMVPFVLPNVLSIAENCSSAEFAQHILPHIKPVMKMYNPIQILLIFMQRMDLLLKLTPCDEVKSDVLPMLYRALESEAQEIQELCLSVLPTFAALIEYPAMKNALLPRIKRLCVSTSFISVRVNCLVCVGKLLEHLDKWLVLDEVLPFLPQIPSREPAVLMGILGIYKLVLSHKKMNISKEVMAGKILPFLMPLSIESTLTLNQFNAIITVIKDMVGRVETEHRVKLEQLHAIQQDQNSLDVGLTPPSAVKSPASSSAQSDFEQLLGMRPSTPSQNHTMPATRVTNDILSLQEKQRLVKERDAATRLQNEPLLSPMPLTVKASPTTTVDLTASLMSDNLSQMSLPKPPPGGSTWQQPVATQWHAWPSNGVASPPQRWPHQWPAMTQAANTTGKVAMNAMPTTGSMQVPLFSSQPMVKPLSSTDINDLLS